MLQVRSNIGAYVIGRHEASTALVRHLNNIRKALMDASHAKAVARSSGIAKRAPGDCGS